MPGFRFLYNTSSRFGEKPNLVCDQICGHNFQLNRFTLNKFLDDKLFVEDEKGIIIIEGVVLNKLDLIKSNNNLVWKDVVWNLYLKHGNEFFNVFRGSFSGLLYDKSKAKWIVFVDHLCTKPLYYYKHEQVLVMSSEIRDIYDYFKENALRAKLKVNSAYMLLSYGYMLENENTTYSS